MLSEAGAGAPVFFILAHATGSAQRYAELLPRLASKARVVPLDLPGHGARRGEPLLDDMEAIREDLAAIACAALDGAGAAGQRGAPSGSPGTVVTDRRYHVFGHSMGVVNGYVMTERLMAMGCGAPLRFFASSFSVPGWHPIPPGMPELPDYEMWRESALRFGVLNGQPIPTPEQMEIHSPVYRADLRAVEGYRPRRLTPLPCPVTAVYAETDMVDAGLVSRWEGHCASLETVLVPGGHFHPLENPGRLEELILARI
ncbi:MAG: alpha/beta fold hydrolase [Deltaproteobacteria bacterium]|nr:alpha/beta fold hydrolase [Deltaproteobacteria bacterium]